ncbi:3-phenylpropionate/cinnamic acid dioxygenase subunit beta [Solwaraspora sp. WMMD1047]|uniref:3-phenylpropionate/cinnamic acid dioxygenase subunit beta n=1 Tax=Solwaraspora sp. WMMD1047 TaxID=3016102 RepID=UPI0024176F7B|nr:3-phenylpropionate/cinnamic acid dioxygenase subunit beta [Solwaraspora sp. WMMD1047]MDG4834298.1 3-phenylpropionate/cinnamic acid dioxygenase subunit beta [Solwaraspora sp. WMMD1047]
MNPTTERLAPCIEDPALQHSIEQFLFDEADLLDSWRFDDWLTLMAPDVHYWMPTRSNRLARERDRQIAAPDEAAYFDENFDHLRQRVFRLNTGFAWSEEPPSRTRHLITNVRVRPGRISDEYAVESSFYVYQTRMERDLDVFVGKRFDLLRRADNPYGWQLVRRKVLLDMATLMAKGLSIFF